MAYLTPRQRRESGLSNEQTAYITPRKRRATVEDQIEGIRRQQRGAAFSEGKKSGIESLDNVKIGGEEYAPLIKTRPEQETTPIINKFDSSKTGGYLANKAISGLSSVTEGLQASQDMLKPQNRVSILGDIEKQRKQDLADRLAQERAELEQAGQDKSGFVRTLGNLTEGATGMIPTMALGAMSGGVMGVPFVMSQASGNAYTQAKQEGADHEQALKYGIGSGLIEGGIEALIGGIPGTKGIADPLIDMATKGIKSNVLKGAARIGLDAAGEGIEEVLSTAINPYLQRATYNPEAKNASSKELAGSFGMGAALSGILGGGQSLINARLNRPTLQQAPIQQQTAQQAPIQAEQIQPVFYTDPYGNVTTDLNQAPLLLPEAKQTAKPQMPTAEELAILNNPTTEIDTETNFPKLDHLSVSEVNSLITELKNDRQKILDEQVNWLKNSMGQGVEQGGIVRDMWGDVVDRFGRTSNNEYWYQQWAKKNNYRKPTKAELYEIAEQQLYEGVQANDTFIPPNEEFIQTDEFINYAESQLNSAKRKSDIQNRLNEYEEARQKEFYAVPFEARREAPFTAVRAQQTAPIGNISESVSNSQLNVTPSKAQQEFTPIGGKLPDPVNKVVMDSQKNKSTLQQKWREFYTKTVDSQDPIVQFSKVANDQTDILASNARNAGGTVDYILTDALVDRQGNKIGKSLKDISESIPQGKETDFWNYMMQRHNIDRAREGNHVIPNYTPEMSMQAVAEIEAKNPEFRAVGDNVTNWLDSFMREWGVNSGIVDAEVYDNLRDTYKSYFPTQREFSEIEKSMPDGVRKQFVDQNSPIKKATGSARDVNNPIENIMSLVNRTVKTAKYNAAGQSFLNSIRNNPNLANIAEIIPAHEGMTANTDNVISVMENGKPVYVKIYDKPLLDALKGLPKTINNAPGMRKLTGAFKNVVTQKNPIFGMVNMMRDIPTAYIYGSEGNPLTFAKDYLTSAKDIVTNNENYQRYKALGGEMSSFFKGDVEAAAKRLSKRGVPILNSIEIFNTMIESNPRFSEFNRVLDATGDVEQALYAANNVTVNFARGGNVTKSIEPFVPYLNAGVQGLDKLVRTFKDPKTALKALIKGGIAVTLPEIALYFINRDKEEYKELDNRTKDMYFLIPTGNGKFIKIPKSRELGIVLGSLFQRVFRAVEGESPESAFKGIGTSFLTNIAPANPIENNIFSPMLNLKSNKDFANRNIVPQAMVMDKRSPYLQYDERSTEIAKAIGNLSTRFVEGGLSPKQIDYLIDAYTGVIGDFLQPLTTKGGNILKPITTRFVADPIYSNQTLTDFYDNYDMLQRAATNRNIIEDLPTSGKANVVTEEEALRNKFSKASSEISKINKQIKAVEATINPDKEKEIRKLRQQIIDIAKEANELLGAAK